MKSSDFISPDAPAVRSLCVQAIQTPVLHGVSLELAVGECIGLSGPSGSGKSRLLRAIADLDPHQGELRLHGRMQTDFPPTDWRRRVGLLPAESRWWADSVGGHFPPTYAEENSDALQALGFDAGVMSWVVSRLSSGEKQRLALLRLLANRPEVLLLDEPTANLDPGNTERMERLLLDTMRQRPAALLWVSHSPEQLARVAQRRYRMEQGRLHEVAA